ncbi:MAG: sodium:solute symporter [Agathobacter sp.]
MALVIAIVYFAALIIVASLYSRKKVKTAEDFANAGGGLGWIMVTFSFVLAPLGSGHTMSLWQKAAGSGAENFDLATMFTGIGAGSMWWAIGAGAIFLPIAMLWIGPMYKRIGAPTAPGAIAAIFGKKLGWFHAAFQTMTWTGIGCSELVATGTAIYTLCNASGIGLSIYQSIILGFVLIVCYVFFGGMLQMAWLNCINACVMLIGSYAAIGIIAVSYLSDLGGWAGIQQIYEAAGYSSFLTQPGTLGLPPVWLGVIIPVIVLHVSAGAVSQTMMQPFFAAKDESACRKGVFLGCGINIMSSLPWIFLAIAAMAIPTIASTVGANGLEAVPHIVQAGLPVPAIGLLMVALLSATLSTGGGVVLANSNVIANDVIIGCVCPDASPKKKMTINRVCIIVAAALLLPGALIMAHEFVFNLFLWVFSFGMPVFVCLLIGYNWKVSRKAAWATIIVTYIIDCIWTFIPMPLPGVWSMNLYAVMVASVVLAVIFHLIFKGEPGWKKTHADRIKANIEAMANK